VPELGVNTATPAVSTVNMTTAFTKAAPAASVTVTVAVAADPFEIVVIACAELSVNARLNVGNTVSPVVVVVVPVPTAATSLLSLQASNPRATNTPNMAAIVFFLNNMF
jgi:hypothetical protein